MKKLWKFNLFLLSIFLLAGISYFPISVNGESGTIGQLTIKTFLGLTDTPNSYTGQSGKVVTVNNTENGLTFTTNTGGGDFLSNGTIPMTGNFNTNGYNILNTGALELDPSYTVTGLETTGMSYWDSANNTLSTVLGNGVIGQHFKELFSDGQNDTGSTIFNGTPVSYAGSIGNSGNFRIKKSQALSTEPAFYFVGIATEDIANGYVGKITTHGKVRGIQTNGANYGESWVDGDIIYVSGNTPGYLTKTAPEAPIPAIPVALVISSHASNGTLEVRPTYPTSMQMLSDVNGTALTTDGQIPVWHNTQKYFNFDKNINNYQLSLVSGTNIKTINGSSILGSGDLVISGTGDVVGPATNIDGYIPLWNGTNSKTLANGIVNNSSNWDTAFSWGNHASAGYLTSSTGLKLDQTTPQNIINGIPLLITSLSSFNSSSQLVNKEYVDSVISFSNTFFFNDTISDIGGIYYKMLDTITGDPESSFVSSALPQGNGRSLYNFATVSGIPGVTMLKHGVYSAHIHANKASLGGKSAQIYFEIYTRTSGGVETLRATSELSELLTTTKSEYDLHATIISDIAINTTDRIIIKWKANIGATGTDAIITLYAENDNASRLSIPTTTDVLSSVFVRQDGTKSLTGNWNAGSYDITAQKFITSGGTSSQFVKGDGTLDSGTYLTSASSLDPSKVSQTASYRFVTDTEKSTWNGKQDGLVSGTNIKTINSTSILGSGNIDTTQTTITGNAGTATALQTARTINGVSFNGTANITVPSDITPGASGNVMTSNGTVWTSATPASTSSIWTAITGTRASNTTITVSGDQTAIFKKGTIVRWQESGVDKVGMVSIPSTYSSPNTTITIIGNTCASIDSSSFKYSNSISISRKQFTIAGNIGATGTNVSNAWYADKPYSVIGAEISVGTAGTTNSTTIDINKGGTTMFTTKPTLATTVAFATTPFTADTATTLALGDKVTLDIDAIQTTNAIDLYVELLIFETRYLTLN